MKCVIRQSPAVDITDDSEQRESRMISVGEAALQA